MNRTNWTKIIQDGLWTNNPALVQVLGLCPLLGVSNSVVNALGLGIATMFVVMMSNICISMIRNRITNAIRLPVFVLVIASLTSCVELLMQAYSYELYNILGIFIPLIVTNCIILGRADAFASKQPLIPAALDGLMMGAGFALVLLLLGSMREIIGTGAIFARMDLLFGTVASHWKLELFDDYQQVLFAILPPGAFVCMGILIAGKNIINQKIIEHQKKTSHITETPSRRIKITH